MEKTLEGKVALVTGGSRGIGAAIAKRLAHDGASVGITYASSPMKAEDLVNTITAKGGRAAFIHANNADEVAVRNAVHKTVETFGRLDILVNNAGIAILGPLDTYSIESFDQMIAVNVRSVFIAAQEAARYLEKGGRIITIGSINADRITFAGGAVYAMTKAAVAGLTRGLARDLGSLGITVNNIQPGPTETDMNPAEGEFADQLKKTLALGRYAHPDEIASMVAFLAGPDAGFITGASLNIDGGYSI